ILAGGAGSDDLRGYSGNDTYRFGIGDGQDAIQDSAGTDRIELGERISADMLRFEAYGNDLVIRIAGTGDSLLVRGGLVDATKLESIVLQDGFTFRYEDVRNALIAGQRTVNDDIVVGFANRADLIDGGAGNDELKGLTGNDIYVIGENPG